MGWTAVRFWAPCKLRLEWNTSQPGMYVRKKCTRPAGSCSIKTLWVFYSIICHTKHLFTKLIQWMTIWQTNSRCSSKPLHSDDPISIINFYSRPNNQIPNTYRSIRVQIRASAYQIRTTCRPHRPVPNSIKSNQSLRPFLGIILVA